MTNTEALLPAQARVMVRTPDAPLPRPAFVVEDMGDEVRVVVLASDREYEVPRDLVVHVF